MFFFRSGKDSIECLSVSEFQVYFVFDGLGEGRLEGGLFAFVGVSLGFDFGEVFLDCDEV